METTYNELPSKTKLFLKQMSEYIHCKLYFYGSVQREDFFPGYSDIDIDIFTENVKTTLTQLSTFLKAPSHKIKKVYMFVDNKLIAGYKLVYKNVDLDTRFEISIFSTKYKTIVLKEHAKKTILPFFALCLMIFLKTSFYNFQLLDSSQYKYLKHFVLSTMIGFSETPYIVVKED
jgi:Nucleotidyltransferase domain